MKKILSHISIFFCCIIIVSCGLSHKGKSDIPHDMVADYYLTGASAMFHQNDFAGAHKLLKKAVDVDPNCDGCYYLLANIYAKSGMVNDALKMSKMALMLDSTNFWYGMQYVQLCDISGNLDKAIETYKFILRHAKDKEELYYDLEMLYVRKADYDTALSICDSIIKHYGFDERVLFARQQIFNLTNNNKAALADGIAFLEKNPENPQANVILGEIFARSNNIGLAEQYFRKAYNIDNDFPAAQFGLAEVYRIQNNYPEHFEFIEKIAENDDIDLSVKVDYLKTSPIWQIAEYRNDNDNLLKKMYESNKESWDFNEFYCAYLISIKQDTLALNIINNELKSDTKNTRAWELKSTIFYVNNDFDKLFACIDSATKYVENANEFIYQKAAVLYMQNNLKKALDALETCKPKDKDMSDKKLELLSEIYFKMDDKKKAFDTFDKLLKSDTSNLTAMNNYAYYLCISNSKLKKALALSKKTIDSEPNNITYLDTYGWILHCMGNDKDADPVFKSALANGGRVNPTILEHYGDVLFNLKEYDRAVLYWEDALSKKDVQNVSEITKKIENCKKIKENR